MTIKSNTQIALRTIIIRNILKQHLLIKYLLSRHCVSGTMLACGDTKEKGKMLSLPYCNV